MIKSVRNRCVIEVFGGVLCVVTLLFGFSVGVRASVIGLNQISSFFLLIKVHQRTWTDFDEIELHPIFLETLTDFDGNQPIKIEYSDSVLYFLDF